jgi:hypothetical protein
MSKIEIIKSGSFDNSNHWYPKALNATIHPLIDFFINLSQTRVVERYCHLNPIVKKDDLASILSYKPKYFRWAGADLINVTTEKGKRHMVVIETNSCPSGQKSMPLRNDHDEFGGYRLLIEETFIPSLKRLKKLKDGVLAVLYDKNYMEASGYAATMAEVMDEDIYLVYFPKEGYDESVRFSDGVLEIMLQGTWTQVRAAFRYVTQKPWNRIPIHTKTKILNPVLACLSGGRNKMLAAKAYDLYNSDLQGTGLEIITPETIRDVSKFEVPLWVKRMGGQAVIKIPYSNAGQGVFTIVGQKELDEFMKMDFEYDQFIVQSLIGNYSWSSNTSRGKLFHVGTVPSKRGYTYVNDLRMMVHSTSDGIKPLSIYSRRAKDPLADEIKESTDSWNMLGTNLSIKLNDSSWDSDTKRLLLMDRRDFNKLGLGIDDLVEAYIQTVLSMIAIDKMCETLVNSKGRFRKRLFSSLNQDDSLIDEILIDSIQ